MSTIRRAHSFRGMETIEQHHTHAPRYDAAKVEDAMHPGVLTCPPETPLWTVARMMESYAVHAIVVTDLDSEGDSDERAWGIVTSLDLVRARVAGTDEPSASGVASTDVVTVSPGDPLSTAAQLMAEHGTEHVVVADVHGRPIAVVSTKDIAAVLARR
jgi:CBS domain-containing protein